MRTKLFSCSAQNSSLISAKSCCERPTFCWAKWKIRGKWHLPQVLFLPEKSFCNVKHNGSTCLYTTQAPTSSTLSPLNSPHLLNLQKWTHTFSSRLDWLNNWEKNYSDNLLIKQLFHLLPLRICIFLRHVLVFDHWFKKKKNQASQGQINVLFCFVLFCCQHKYCENVNDSCTQVDMTYASSRFIPALFSISEKCRSQKSQ